MTLRLAPFGEKIGVAPDQGSYLEVFVLFRYQVADGRPVPNLRMACFFAEQWPMAFQQFAAELLSTYHTRIIMFAFAAYPT